MEVRLLFATAESWPTFRPDVAVLFGKYLPRLGIRSDLVTGATPGVPAEWGGGEAFTCAIDCGPARRHLRTFLHGVRVLAARGRAGGCHALQVRDLPVLAAIGLLIARWRGLPFFYWMSYPIPEGEIALARERGLSAGAARFLFPWVSGRLGRLLLYRFVLPRADHVFVQSGRMQAELARRGLDPARMTPVPMGVDVEAAAAAGPAADDPRLAGRRVLVYLGTTDRPRRIEVLFAMLALLRRQLPDALLVIVGDTADDVHRAWLREQAAAAGVADHVVWTGWLPTAEAWRYVRAAALALSPIPRGELLDVGSPTKVAEYLALGVPVLGNDNPDQAQVIAASGGGLCVPYTAADFAAAAARILADPAPWRDVAGGRGREYVAAERGYAGLAERVAEVYRRWA
jgi:glycosyltransferase involved in cell wall biosynthesis